MSSYDRISITDSKVFSQAKKLSDFSRKHIQCEAHAFLIPDGIFLAELCFQNLLHFFFAARFGKMLLHSKEIMSENRKTVPIRSSRSPRSATVE